MTLIALLAGAVVGAVIFYLTGWGADMGALLGGAAGLSASVGWFWGSRE